MEVILYIWQQFSLLTKMCFSIFHIEEFADTKGVLKIRQSKDRQRYGQKKKHQPRSTKHTHKITNSSNMNPAKNRGCTHALWELSVKSQRQKVLFKVGTRKQHTT